MAKPQVRQKELVLLDGRTLEGGGQLLRIAFCLSALTGTPVQVNDIRGKRSGGGGLKPQHLTCVQWLAQACNARYLALRKEARRSLWTRAKDSQCRVGCHRFFRRVHP